MQVFIVGSPLETAKALDGARLRKQIIEVGQILGALDGAKAWSNHPAVLQYREYKFWLMFYRVCLEYYQRGNIYFARQMSHNCKILTPKFHTQEYFDQMKRRLYTKDPQHYAQWAQLGESVENWYFVEGEWRKYVNGKRIE